MLILNMKKLFKHFESKFHPEIMNRLPLIQVFLESTLNVLPSTSQNILLEAIV